MDLVDFANNFDFDEAYRTTTTRVERDLDDDPALEKLLFNVNAPEILAAADGLRPRITDSDALPLVDGKLHMAPDSAGYAVTRTGDGTEVTLYGTTAEGHSCAVRVNGFYPYLYVRLGTADARKLVRELDATLLEMIATQGEDRSWAPEYRSIVESLVGRVFAINHQHAVLAAAPAHKRRVRPVVGWEIVDGTLLRGSGDDRGYRGLEARRFLKIYFLLPGLVPKAKQLLHGAHNEFGPMQQAAKLARGRSSMEDRLSAEAEQAAAANQDASTSSTKKPIGKEYGRLRYLDAEFAKKWVPHGDTGEGDGMESSDDEAGDADADFGTEDTAVLGTADVVETDDLDEENAVMLPPLALDEKRAIRAEQVATSLYEHELQEEAALYGDEGGDLDLDAPFALQRRRRGVTDAGELGRDANSDEGKKRLAKLANDLLHKMARDELSTTRGAHVTDSYLNAADPRHTFTVCEADIDFILRLAIDAGFSYNQFIEIDLGTELRRSNCHRVRQLGCNVDARNDEWSPPDTPPGLPPLVPRAHRVHTTDKSRTTRCDIEIYCDFHHIALSKNADLQRTVPHRVTLSLDCEMETHGVFPTPENNAVLQVGCVIPLPDGKRREVGFTVGRLARGAGEFVDVLPETGTKRPRTEDEQLEDDADVLRALTNREFRRTLDPDVESEHILCFDSESAMLTGLAVFVRRLAPNIIITFNGDNFDMPYLIARSKMLGIGKVFIDAWGASIVNPRVKAVDRSFATTAIGKHEYKEVTAAGRLFYDIFQYWKRNPMLKERSYSLNALSQKYLGMEKENVAYSQIDTLQQTPEGRRKLLRYCVRDALLPVLLDRKQVIGYDLLEKSRGTGVPIEMLLKRGMQVQCKTYLYRKSRIGILVPELARGMPSITDAGKRRPAFWYTRTDEERRAEMHGPKYDGATVIEPERGLHDEPIVTLDFRALYPSIMTSGNYCPSTLIAPNFNYAGDAYFKHLVDTGVRTWNDLFMSVGTVTYDPRSTSTEYVEKIDNSSLRFIRHDVLRGFVPDIERELLLWRDSVKIELKAAKAALSKLTDRLAELEKAPSSATTVEYMALPAQIAAALILVCVLDRRQHSIKLIANSLYGVFGAKTSFCFCLDLADSVTRRGRAAILLARWLALHVINDITPEHPVARKIAEFPGLTNQLVTLDPGAKVVDELCKEMAAARKTKPRVAKPAEGAPRPTKKTGGLDGEFDAIIRQQKQAAQPGAAKTERAAGDIEDPRARINVVYG